MTHVDLFSGIGGFALATKWTGFETVVFCEKDEFCQKVLQKRFGGFIADPESINRWNQRENLRNGKGRKGRNELNEIHGNIPIIPEIRDFDGTQWRGATLLTGGFPCQPFSVAGQQRGKEDDRYLWPEMLRVIKEAKPTWVIAENVAGIVKLALGQVLFDLESIGYDFPRDHRGAPIVPVIPACGLNAPHRRYRIWVIAYSKGIKLRRRDGNNRQERGTQNCFFRNSKTLWQIPWIEVAAEFCRVDDGVSNRVDRLKSLGNAIIPQIVAEIMRGIRMIEEARE